MIKQRYGLPTFLTLGAGLFFSSSALAAEWEENVDYGGGTAMNLYVPDAVDDAPGVVVALHSCGNQYEGDSRNYVQAQADQYGFIIIQPTNGSPDCWTADAGQAGEKPDILSMVAYVMENHAADPERVFAMGASSGACMTLALLATSPDVFSGGATLAGVPYGAWRAGGTCSVCNQPASPQSEEEWGNIVRENAPAGFTGPWPKVQLWHATGDATLAGGWLAEAEKQWKNVHGLTGSGTSATAAAPWTRTEYTSGSDIVLQVNSWANTDHYLPDDVPKEDVITFFGLDQDGAPTPDPTPDAGGGSGEPGVGGGGTGGNGGTGGTGGTPVTPEPTTAPSSSAAPTAAPSAPASVPVAPSASAAPQASASTAQPVASATGGGAPSATGASTGAPPAAATTNAGAGGAGPIANNTEDSEGGCACAVPHGQGNAGAWALFAAGLLTVLRRRRG